MEYKYEIHCHTKEVSRCGQVYAKDAVAMYREKGYSGIVITDHYSPMTFSPLQVYRPQKFTEFYISGYKNALKAAGKDFTVLLGMELRFYATANDYLVYGITEDFLKNNGNLMTYYPRRFYNLARKNNLLFVQAHPFREGMIRSQPSHIDGCEIYNGKNRKSDANAKAEEWAKENNMQIRTGGSDFHKPKDLATSGIITETPIKTNDDLLKILRNNDFEIIRTDD